ncbi:MAG: hypothetical protein HFH82_01205 [Lachnospiraceae bacterium]|nr:hypothetical protein [Lachnospiraceae bacterium]
MNLKEAYRYANFLNDLLERSFMYLRNTGFISTVEQKHFRSKVDKDAQDETMIAQKPFDVDFSPMDLVDFDVKVLAEKEALMGAISAAKAKVEINIDNGIAMNKKKQYFIEILKNMADMKASTKKMMGTGYRFNVNNEQVSYIYDVEAITTIDFDRNDIRNLMKKYHKETDEISAKLDAIEINTMVDFTPQWDVNDTLEDILTEE